MNSTPPVLFLIFNRPDHTVQVMEQIRQAEPPQLFVSADGPRAYHPDDSRRCEQAREVASRVDWDCEVYTLFRDENLGCKEAVSSAITWFFEHVEEGIILEDDCVPHATFFPYCSELLERYRGDERIMVVSGDNFQPDSRDYDYSYYFSAYNHCWGWATWRQSWGHYDGNLGAWSDLKSSDWLHGWLASETAAQYWESIFDRSRNGEIDSWAYPWTFSCWAQHGLSVLPSVNLVSNIGFGPEATNTRSGSGRMENLSSRSISFPLEHPQQIVRDYTSDRYTTRHHFGAKTKANRLVRQYIPDSVKKASRYVLKGRS